MHNEKELLNNDLSNLVEKKDTSEIKKFIEDTEILGGHEDLVQKANEAISKITEQGKSIESEVVASIPRVEELGGNAAELTERLNKVQTEIKEIVKTSTEEIKNVQAIQFPPTKNAIIYELKNAAGYSLKEYQNTLETLKKDGIANTDEFINNPQIQKAIVDGVLAKNTSATDLISTVNKWSEAIPGFDKSFITKNEQVRKLISEGFKKAMLNNKAGDFSSRVTTENFLGYLENSNFMTKETFLQDKELTKDGLEILKKRALEIRDGDDDNSIDQYQEFRKKWIDGTGIDVRDLL